MGITKEELSLCMRHATGTMHYYKHFLAPFNYTDGVKLFADKAEAYWFIDIVASILKKIYKRYFVSVTLTVKDEEADFVVLDNNKVVYKQHISYTDCPEGVWKFYYTNNVLLWNGEY